jgi:alkylation response protein AidB-like acyl-CoA dehydrogenase
MELADSPAEGRFRAEVREWLAAALPTLGWPEPADLADRPPFWRPWQRLLFEAGYAGLSWPKEFGGGGVDAKMRAIFAEETDRAGAPDRLNTIGEDFAGPTIIEYGTQRQKERFLRPILTGDDIWCQLFSEPEAGSDLASLRTTASKVAGGWRVQGQKIWTSRAHLAAHAILLARTGGAPRHKGITYFLLPMDAEGVTVRPLRHMLGEAEFNEVFLDDVFIADDLVLGEVDGGWRVAMATLSYERVAIATGRVNTKRAVDDIIADIRGRSGEDGRPLGEDRLVRQQVADLYGRALIHYLIGQRVVALAADDGPPGPVTSIGKLYFCPLVEDLADFALSLDPLGGQFDPAGEARWLRLAYQARGTAIAGGSTFIQRNIVAERMLGMPRS